jgi:hypothetical protein
LKYNENYTPLKCNYQLEGTIQLCDVEITQTNRTKHEFRKGLNPGTVACIFNKMSSTMTFSERKIIEYQHGRYDLFNLFSSNLSTIPTPKVE